MKLTEQDDLDQYLALLPHGPGFRFVDRLIELDTGVSASGEYRLRGDEFFLPGHFPGNPMMPGVILVEAVAQLAGVVAQSVSLTPSLPGLKLAALRQVKMLGAARPGDVIRLEAALTGRLDLLIQAEGKAFVNDRLILQASITMGCNNE